MPTIEKKSPAAIGLLQAIAISTYCALIAGFFFAMSKNTSQPGFFGFFLMLTLLVFSAAITGTLVFGYPVYLVLVKNKIKEALTILAFTLLFTFILILTTAILILIFT